MVENTMIKLITIVYDQVKFRKEVWRTNIFGGQNWLNFDLVPKILSAEYFVRWNFVRYGMTRRTHGSQTRWLYSMLYMLCTWARLSQTLSVLPATRTCKGPFFMTHALWEFLRVRMMKMKMSSTKIKISVVAPVACDLTKKTSYFLTSFSLRNSHKEVKFYRWLPCKSLRSGVLIEL